MRLKSQVYSSSCQDKSIIVWGITILVDIPTDAQLEAIQNSQLFEGDIMGMPTTEEEALRRRLRDEPVDTDEAVIFGRPVINCDSLDRKKN